MALSTGDRLGVYEVMSLLGMGGMGEVYRARDTRLGRDVALKVLPDRLAGHPDRLARFEREARILASLNHPHIAAIYGLEESRSTRALVLELVEGPTLADRIADGPLSIPESLEIAGQIAGALEAAHEQGITHRDLKPANIKVRPDGAVKVLDFGLAKLTEPSAGAGSSDDSDLSTTLSGATTGVGVILGTAAYMSPEQAKGQTADKRSDIWAFGCVLFEMLTGRRLFHGKDLNETIAFVLTKDPDWNLLPSGTPPAVRTLLRRCVERDRRKRVGDVAAIRFVLDEPATIGPVSVTSAEGGGVQQSAWPRVAAIGAVALVAAIAIGGAFVRGLLTRTPAADSDVFRFPLAAPEGWRVYVPDGIINGPIAMSPDGRRLAFIGRNTQGGTQLWIHAFDALAATPVAGTEGASFPFWSPDAASLGFFANGQLKKVPVAGGTPVTICETPPGGRSGTWGADGTILFATFASPLWQVSSAGGTPKPATALGPQELLHSRPTFLPDGRHFLYSATISAATEYKTFVGTLGAPGQRVELPLNSPIVRHANGRVFFGQGTTLMAQPFDDQRLALVDEAAPVVDGVRMQTQAGGVVAVFSVSDRALAYQSETAGANTLVWLDRAGRQLGTLADRATYTNLDMTADNLRLVAGVLDPLRRTRDIWSFDTARGVGTRITSDPAEERSSVWSPDGRQIVFNSNRTGAFELYRKDADTAGEGTLFFSDGRSKDVTSWSPDGRYLLYRVSSQGVANDIWVLPLGGDRKPFPFVATPFSETMGGFAPDGRHVVYVSDESGRNEVYVAAFPGAGGKVRISTDGGTFPRWRADGKELFYLAPDNMVKTLEITEAGRPALAVGATRDLFTINVPAGSFNPYVVSRDGQRFLVNTDVGSATTIAIVVNWASALKK